MAVTVEINKSGSAITIEITEGSDITKYAIYEKANLTAIDDSITIKSNLNEVIIDYNDIVDKLGSTTPSEYIDELTSRGFFLGNSIIDSDPKLAFALATIFDTYGDIVSIDAKKKSLRKFGRNENMSQGVRSPISFGNISNYATGNDINEIVSNDNSDTQDVVIEGHTLSGSDLTFVVQTITLTGTTPVTLTTPLYRATRLYNNGTTDFAGTITLSDDGITNYLQTDGANNQSLRCATSLSSQDYWIVTKATGSVIRNATAVAVDFELHVREFGKVFRNKQPFSAHSYGGLAVFDFDPYEIIIPNSDIEMLGTATTNATQANATIQGYLGLVIS